MLTVERLKKIVGPDKYAAACSYAWENVVGTGSRRNATDAAVMYEVLDVVELEAFDSPASALEKMKVLISLYPEMPSYSLIMRFFITIPYRELTEDMRPLFWKFVRKMLSSPEAALADPVSYLMWVSFFEDEELAQEAWREVVTDDANDQLLERVLIASGPVLFELKRQLYDLLIQNQRWHPFIFRSLLHSNYDLYGKLDRAVAKRLLERLKLPAKTENLQMLKDTFGVVLT